MKLSLFPQVELDRRPWPHLSACRVLRAQKSSVWSLAITSHKAWPPWGPNSIHPSLPWHWAANQLTLLSATHVPSTVLGAGGSTQKRQIDPRPPEDRYEGSCRHGTRKTRARFSGLWSARLTEAQAGIQTAGRNANNLRYAHDTTLMAESRRGITEPLGEGERGEWKSCFKIQHSKLRSWHPVLPLHGK